MVIMAIINRNGRPIFAAAAADADVPAGRTEIIMIDFFEYSVLPRFDDRTLFCLFKTCEGSTIIVIPLIGTTCIL
jgi:hypothetical protein